MLRGYELWSLPLKIVGSPRPSLTSTNLFNSGIHSQSLYEALCVQERKTAQTRLLEQIRRRCSYISNAENGPAWKAKAGPVESQMVSSASHVQVSVF